jgi:hypothetical protein
MSFLPHFAGDSDYPQEMLPYLTLTEAQYEEYMKSHPAEVSWPDLGLYERGEDTVTGTREFACIGNTCELIDAATPV